MDAAPAAAPDPAAVFRYAQERHRKGDAEAAIAAYRLLISSAPEAAAGVVGNGWGGDPAASRAPAGGAVPLHQAEVLLANLLLMAPPPTPMQRAVRRVEALALVDRAAARADGVADARDRALLLARVGYFLLQAHGAAGGGGGNDSGGGDGDEEGGGAGSGGGGDATAVAGTPLGRAVAALEQAVALDPGIPIAWRNLSVCYRGLGRDGPAEAAAGRAVEAAGARVTSDLLYRHAKALRRLRSRDADAAAAGRYCDVLRVEPTHALGAFWLRVMLAESAGAGEDACKAVGDGGSAGVAGGGGRCVLPAPVVARMRETLAASVAAPPLGEGSVGGGGGAAAAVAVTPSPPPPTVPHEYIRRLFDGYSRHFDAHLVGALGYRTPHALLLLALEAAAAAAAVGGGGGEAVALTASRPTWRRCADLGCGTGLAGVEFRPWVTRLEGVDLSGGMVAEARKRRVGDAAVVSAAAGGAGAAPAAAAAASGSATAPPLYDALDVGEVEAWLRARPRGAQAPASNTGGAAPVLGHGYGYDLLVCADVLVYIGALEGVFAAAASAMEPSRPPSAQPPAAPPSIFVLSTEREPEEGADGAQAGFRLTGTGRCTHKRSYVEAAAAGAGFTLLAARRQAIRQNAGEDVMGDLYVFQL